MAHHWCDHAQAGALSGLRLVTALRGHFSNRGLYLLGAALVSHALARPGAQAPDLARCRALGARAFLVFFVGRYEQSMVDAQASRSVAQQLHHDAEVAFALWIIGFDHMALGRLHEARAAFEQSLDLSRAIARTATPPAW